MSIPVVYQSIRPQDVSITPITVHKRYVIHKSDIYSGSLPFTASGYKIWTGVHHSGKLKIGTRSYPTNSFDGSNQHVIWNMIDAMYYRYPNDSYATFEHPNDRYTYKFLNYSASVFVAPQQDFGEGILPGSVIISNEDYNINLRDDGHGNLYDYTQPSSSFSDPNRLTAYWDFNTAFRKFDLGQNIDKDIVSYKSHTFTPDRSSTIRNITFSKDSAIGYLSGGVVANFLGSSSIYTPNRSEFNFTDDFSIGFWAAAPVSQSHTLTTSTILSKHGTIEKQVFGMEDKYNENGLAISTKFVSSSIEDLSINVYPYKFEYTNYTHPTQSIVKFTRTDGINTSTVVSTTLNSGWNHICMTKSGSLLSMYLNGFLVDSGTDRTDSTYNGHSIVFGANNLGGSNQFSGSMHNIRFYEYALSPESVGTLASVDQSAAQSYVVGNVFYKKGMIVVSSFADNYMLTFDPAAAWIVEYRNTHTIYQWETVIRIPKGSFNLSQNKTSLQNPYTDLLKNEFTSSGNANSDLTPYATAIGLVNDNKDLLAVAKLSQPLKMRTDVDMNIIIRWDT